MRKVLDSLACIILSGASACHSLDPALATRQEQFSRRFPAAEVNSLRIASHNGNVTIRGKDGEHANIVASTTGDCKVDATLRHGEVAVVLHGKQFWSKCSGSLKIDVPRKLTVDVSSGSGDLNIVDIDGTLSLRTGSGDVRAGGAFEQLVAKSGSGDMRLSGLSGSAVIATGSGDVQLTYTKLPEGTLHIDQGSGHMQIVVPNGPISTQVQAGSGSVDNRVTTDPEARFLVRGAIGSGNLRIVTEG